MVQNRLERTVETISCDALGGDVQFPVRDGADHPHSLLNIPGEDQLYDFTAMKAWTTEFLARRSTQRDPLKSINSLEVAHG